MSYNHDPVSPGTIEFGPGVTSYDTGYEHSQEHLLALEHLVAEADEPECAAPSASLVTAA